MISICMQLILRYEYFCVMIYITPLRNNPCFTYNHLRNFVIFFSRRENDVRKAQQFTKDITAVTEQMVELERAHGRHENILADLSNVESNINQLNKNITGLKRDADFKLKTNQLQITKMQNQEETLYDDKERQADQNTEYFDIKKGLTRNLKQIQLEHEELKLTKNFYEKETPFMQVIAITFASSNRIR